MADQNTSGSPIAITLVSQTTADGLAQASRALGAGGAYVWIGSGTGVSPAELFRNLGWADPIFRDNATFWMTLVIVNYFDKPLIAVGQTLPQGIQVRYPVESELAGAYISGTAPD